MNPLLASDNHLLNLARSGRRLPHIILAIVLSFVFVFVAQFIGSIPAMGINIALSSAGQTSLDSRQAVMKAAMPSTALEQVIFLALIFAPIFLLLWVWLAFYEKRALWTIGLERAGAGLNYLRGLGAGLLMFMVTVGLMALFGYVAAETGNPQQQGLAALGGVLFVFLGWMVQGAAEEAIARGWLMPVIAARYKPVLGVIISALVFAVYHSLNPNLNPVAVLNLFLFGLFTALYTLYEGGLWGVFGIHAAWNWAQGNLFGLEVSGLNPVGGILFNLKEAGPDIFTGGAFGPEGGLAVTAVLMASMAAVWLVSQRKETL